LRSLLPVVYAVVASVALVACSRDGRELRPATPDQNATVAITTTVAIDPPNEAVPFSVAGPWRDGDVIADEHTCRGAGTPPGLEILGIPAGAVALAVLLVDLAQPERPLWLITDLPPDARVLASGIPPADARAVVVGDGGLTWVAPCPAAGERREYILSVYALDSPLPPDLAVTDVDAALTAVEERAFDITESVFLVGQ
jgi:phosphatidylethanolamine-binding protein (PEBP) family uncharacterized protein